MQKATLESMELGNIVFGNSRGNYSIVPRADYEDMFYNNFLIKIGADAYGHPDNFKIFGLRNSDELAEFYDNDIFVMRPYYWGDDEALMVKPNFEFKPKHITISWYKYPMRDAYCNQDLTLDEFDTMLAECVDEFNTLLITRKNIHM